MQIFGTILARLGLFFIGVKLISSNLKEMSGGTFRRLIARITQDPFRAGVVGTLGGTLTQSTNAMTFIVISIVTSGLVALRKAIPIVIWANLGTSALVLLATLDMHVMILFLLGITGVGFYFDLDKSNRYRFLLGALLGIGMLFYGRDLIKTGAASGSDQPGRAHYLAGQALREAGTARLSKASLRQPGLSSRRGRDRAWIESGQSCRIRPRWLARLRDGLDNSSRWTGIH